MTWLGHHEFGADHRPFLFDGAPGRDEDPTGVGYWLKLWDSVHRALLSAPARVRERQFFVDYDALCASPRRYAPRLAVLVEAPIASAALRAAEPRHAEADPALLARVAETHAALRACFRARFD